MSNAQPVTSRGDLDRQTRSGATRPARRNRRLPRRGVRPGPARFEIAVAAGFLLSMVAAVVSGGPTDLPRAFVIAVPFFLLGLLVVRRELFVVIAFPVLLSVFFDDRTSHELRIENPQVVFWLVGALLWAPAVLLGYSIRKSFDRRGGGA